MKATAKFVDHELFHPTPTLSEHLLFILRIAAILIIVGVFFTTSLYENSNANRSFETVDTIHQHPTRMITRATRVLANLYLPPIVRTVVIRALGTVFGVNFSDVLYPLEHFTSWNDFFGRKIIPRPIDKTQFSLVSPADSKLLSLQEVTEDSILLIKNIKYSVGNFLTGVHNTAYSEDQISSLKFK